MCVRRAGLYSMYLYFMICERPASLFPRSGPWHLLRLALLFRFRIRIMLSSMLILSTPLMKSHSITLLDQSVQEPEPPA